MSRDVTGMGTKEQETKSGGAPWLVMGCPKMLVPRWPQDGNKDGTKVTPTSAPNPGNGGGAWQGGGWGHLGVSPGVGVSWQGGICVFFV